VGGAVVFSCALMHAVSRAAAARIRAANNQFLDPSIGTYKGG
jgi:hypothetical protein